MPPSTRLHCDIDSQSERHLLAAANVTFLHFHRSFQEMTMWQGRRPQHCQAVVAIRAPPTGDCKCHVFTLSSLIPRDDNAVTTTSDEATMQPLDNQRRGDNAAAGQPATGRWPGRRPQHYQAVLAFPSCVGCSVPIITACSFN